MKNEYSAEPEAIFVSGHASLNRGFLKTITTAYSVRFWRFQPEIARTVWKLIEGKLLITVNVVCWDLVRIRTGKCGATVRKKIRR